MGLLDWLWCDAVESPQAALRRDDLLDPAQYTYRCTDFSDYLKQRREMVDATAERLEAQYRNAEDRARAVCETYAEGLAERERRLVDAEDAFLSRRKVVIAALRDSNNCSLADVIASETFVGRVE